MVWLVAWFVFGVTSVPLVLFLGIGVLSCFGGVVGVVAVAKITRASMGVSMVYQVDYA